MASVSTLVRNRPVLSSALLALALRYIVKVVKRLCKPCLASGEAIPWARGWKPIIGHMGVMVKYMKDNNKLAAGRLAIGVKESDGLDIFRVEMLGMEMNIVSNLDAIEEIVTNDPKRFTKNFEAIPTFKFTKELFGNGLFFANTDSEDWILPHHILKAPFSVKGVKALFPMMCEQADLLVKCLKREVGYGGVCHIDHWVTKMAFETIAVCATGTSFGSFDDDQDTPFVKALNGTMAGFGPLMKVPPKLWPILKRKQVAEIRAHAKVLRDVCLEVVRKRRSQETRSMSSRKDIMDMMLHDVDSKTGKKLSEVQIVDNILTFLFAGQDSTAAAMATLLCFLNTNPRCKEKLMEEIDAVVGTGQFEVEHLSQMKYLDWCIKESMRLVPPAAGVMRVANGDQTLLGKYRVPSNSMLMVGIMAAHYDQSIWGEDARDFRPERWETPPSNKFAFMPFAVGPRACTGREFTLIEQKITFVKLFQHFDFKRPERVQPEEGYTTLKKESQTMVPFIGMDIEFKTTSAFVGLYSAFELLERNQDSLAK